MKCVADPHDAPVGQFRTFGPDRVGDKIAEEMQHQSGKGARVEPFREFRALIDHHPHHAREVTQPFRFKFRRAADVDGNRVDIPPRVEGPVVQDFAASLEMFAISGQDIRFQQAGGQWHEIERKLVQRPKEFDLFSDGETLFGSPERMVVTCPPVCRARREFQCVRNPGHLSGMPDLALKSLDGVNPLHGQFDDFRIDPLEHPFLARL